MGQAAQEHRLSSNLCHRLRLVDGRWIPGNGAQGFRRERLETGHFFGLEQPKRILVHRQEIVDGHAIQSDLLPRRLAQSAAINERLVLVAFDGGGAERRGDFVLFAWLG